MANNFGARRVIRELKIEVDKNLNVDGFVDLVGQGKVELIGPITKLFNEKWPNEINQKNLPLIIHLKLKKTIKENELIYAPYQGWTQDRTAKEYTKYFTRPQKIVSLKIWKSEGILNIEGFSEPYGDFRFLTSTDSDNVLILQEKNVPVWN